MTLSIGIFDSLWLEKSPAEKAVLIHEELKGKDFVLFLDDFWDSVRKIKELGTPLSEASCLLIYTTRQDGGVVGVKEWRVLELKALSMEDSWQLFQNKVGDMLLEDPIRKIGLNLVMKCEGVPLFICALGRSMASKKTVAEWLNALDEIKIKGMYLGKYYLLHFCFDKLPDRRIRSCLLYFSLFPEDFTLHKNNLMDFWICEQLFGRNNTSLFSAYNAIETLIGAGLVEQDNNNHVKLLDTIRDTALDEAITVLLFCNAQFIRATDTEILKNHAGWVYPIASRMRQDKNDQDKILTFLFNHNPFVMVRKHTPSSTVNSLFPEFLESLTVIDLSNCGVQELPREISSLISLQYLDLSHTWIERLPIELKTLKKSKCLNLEYNYQLRQISRELMFSLSSLHVLKLFRCGFSVEEGEDNILSLRRMDIDPLSCFEHLKVLSITITCISALNKIFSNTRLSSCTQSLSLEVFWGTESLDISPLMAANNLLTLEIHQAEHLKEFVENLCYLELYRQRSFESLREVNIAYCSRLQELTWVIRAPHLRVLKVGNCEEMKDIISTKHLGEARKDAEPFAKLQILELDNLPKLKSIYWKALSFKCLKRIKVIDCLLLKQLPLNSHSTKANETVIDIETEEDWLKGINWEDDATKNRFASCFKPLLG